MKREIRARMIALSATAVMASFTTFFTTGCSGKGKSSEESDITIINDSNIAQMSAEKDKLGSRSNSDLFRWKPVKSDIEEVTAGATETGTTLFDTFKIYENKDGKYFVIDKGKAYELLKGVDGYQIVKEESQYYVLTNLEGQRLMVFGGEEALKDFTKMLKDKFEAAKADNKVLTIVNGIYVGDPVESKEVSRYDGTRTYYDFEAIMKTCIKGIEAGGYADPISYEKSEDGKSWVVKRTAYSSDGSGGTIGGKEMRFELPIGESGEVYYDTTINMFIGIVYEQGGKYWICQDALYHMLGIDVLEGEYTVPGTTDKYDALIIDTAGGSDEPKFVTEEKSGVDVVIDPTMGQGSSGVVAQTPDGSLGYDVDIKNKLGIEVVLTGSNAEQAQQYADACRAAYPDLPWTNNGTSAGLELSALVFSSSFDAWAEGVTDESVDAMINEKLAGRDYHDLSINELAEFMPYTSRGTNLGAEISGYLSELTHRDFNNGGYYID